MFSRFIARIDGVSEKEDGEGEDWLTIIAMKGQSQIDAERYGQNNLPIKENEK